MVVACHLATCHPIVAVVITATIQHQMASDQKASLETSAVSAAVIRSIPEVHVHSLQPASSETTLLTLNLFFFATEML